MLVLSQVAGSAHNKKVADRRSEVKMFVPRQMINLFQETVRSPSGFSSYLTYCMSLKISQKELH